MNRIASRAMALFLVAVLLAGGFVFFMVEYFANGKDWALFPGSPHVYNGGNIGCGVVVDRSGVLLLDLNEGRSYSNLLALRQSVVHWVGDRYGSISAPALTNYAAQMAGFDPINGVEQKLNIRIENGKTIVERFILKDYPMFLRG